jgi:hypothetical protein
MKTKSCFRAAWLASLVMLTVSLTACGGGGSDTSAAQTGPASSGTPPAAQSPTPTPIPTPTPVPAANRAPTITGSAPPSVVAGQTYNFVPSAADADGDSLQFAISSKPAWASFDPATGRLWGVPTNANAGSYEEIEVSVTDGTARTALSRFAVAVSASAPVTKSVTLSWQPPTANSDGSTLTDLSGYRIVYGSKSGVYSSSVTISNAGLTGYVLENLPSGRYYIAMVSVNSAGAESAPSQEVAVDLS